MNKDKNYINLLNLILNKINKYLRIREIFIEEGFYDYATPRQIKKIYSLLFEEGNKSDDDE